LGAAHSPRLTSQMNLPLASSMDFANDTSHGPKTNLFSSTAALLSTADWCSVFVPVILYWTYSSLLYTLSVLGGTTLEIHKIPLGSRPQNKVSMGEVLKAVFLQHVVQMALAVFLALITKDTNQDRMEVWWLAIAKIVAATFILDTYQYWTHRLFHYNKFLYRNFHSIHHRLTNPYAFGALYNHPVEGFLMDTIGSGIPALLLGMHSWTACIFFSLATLKTVDDHCGYTWPYDPFQHIFSNTARYHDIHHWGRGKMYNFSQPFYTHWDKWMHTDYEDAILRGQISREVLLEEKVAPPKSKSKFD